MTRAASLIAGVREAVNALRTYDPDPDEIADAAAWVRELEVMLADWRRKAEAKATRPEPPADDDTPPDDQPPSARPVVEGAQFRLVPQYKTVRTYNTGRLLVDLAAGLGRLTGTDPTIGHLIQVLDSKGVLSIDWKYRQLVGFAKLLDVQIVRGTESIDDPGDMDLPHIGEVEKPNGHKRVRIT